MSQGKPAAVCVPDDELDEHHGGVVEGLKEELQGLAALPEVADDAAQGQREDHDPQHVHPGTVSQARRLDLHGDCGKKSGKLGHAHGSAVLLNVLGCRLTELLGTSSDQCRSMVQ